MIVQKFIFLQGADGPNGAVGLDGAPGEPVSNVSRIYPRSTEFEVKRK